VRIYGCKMGFSKVPIWHVMNQHTGRGDIGLPAETESQQPPTWKYSMSPLEPSYHSRLLKMMLEDSQCGFPSPDKTQHLDFNLVHSTLKIKIFNGPCN
jgi:hypothetical protein